MRYLVDTHVLIWFLEGDERLSETHKKILENQENQILVSDASFWELAIKISIKKLELQCPFEELKSLLEGHGIHSLPIAFPHFNKLLSLPIHHGDPFDRLIIAQAMVEKLPVLSADFHFQAYAIELI